MAVEAEKLTRRWTYEDYCRLDDDKRYEIIDGELFMAPAPDTWHQSWSRELFRLIDSHVRRGKSGKVFFAPLDGVLPMENAVQPDIIFVANANLSIIQRPAIFGVPDLLVELVSPSSIRRDRHEKRDLYARFGVKEYWIGDPANKALEILTLKNGRYELHCCVEEQGTLSSLLLPGLGFELSEILQPGRTSTLRGTSGKRESTGCQPGQCKDAPSWPNPKSFRLRITSIGQIVAPAFVV